MAYRSLSQQNSLTTFLTTIKLICEQTEMSFSKKDVINLYNKDISPYGYHSFQTILIEESITAFLYNARVLEDDLKTKQGDPLFLESINTGENICPQFYVTDELALSLINTKPPQKISIREDISLDILPVISVIFSKKFKQFKHIGIIKKDNGIKVRLSWYASKNGKSFYVPLKFFIPFTTDDPECCTYCDVEKAFLESRCLAENYSKLRSAPFPNVDKGQKMTDVIRYDYDLFAGDRKELLTHEDAENVLQTFATKIREPYRFVINLLLLMTQQPEIITVQSPKSNYVATSSKGFNTQKVNNIPNTHWLGSNFTVRTQPAKSYDIDSDDVTRAAPKKSHWRRGHWHTILQGPGRLQRKLKWFKPVFIKGNKQEVI